jgi:CIC family chloride channel protein
VNDAASGSDAHPRHRALEMPHTLRYLGRMRDDRTFRVVILALTIGILGGFAGIALRLLLSFFHELFFVHAASLLSFLGPYYVLILPSVGGLIVGFMVVFLAREARGAGVSDVVLAVLFRGSRMRPRVAGVKVVATSVVIGSGGSGGIEGPIIQIGSAIGSSVGQWLKFTEEDTRIALASGAAAGIAATFNTPLAGVFFALEVILIDFSSRSFGMVVMSSVAANVVARLTLGNDPIFVVPQYAMVHPGELLLYLLLGGAAAVVGVAFTTCLDHVEAVFANWKFPDYLKPALGGFIVGVIGLFLPQVFGLGYETINDAAAGRLPFVLLVALVVAKLVATSVTVGSGASGGVIGPSLYLGGMLGGATGILFNTVFPQGTAPSGAYAMVGMAAVFSATAHAPMTAIFTLFELTNDYKIMLPLMVSCVTSAYLAYRITPHTIYSVGLIRRGIDVQKGRVSLPLQPGTIFLDLLVSHHSPVAGKRVKDLDLPTDCILVSVRRRSHSLIPRGNTLIKQGDRVVIVSTPENEELLRSLIEVAP